MTDYIKYIIILTCFIISVLVRFLRRARLSVLNLALCFTALADIFLIFTDMYAVGIVLFMAVQACYCVAVNRRFTPADLLLDILYFPLSAANFVRAFLYFVHYFKAKRLSAYRFFAAMTCGVFLLFLCDINVVTANVPLFPYAARRISRGLIWIFYIPSQLFIVFADFLLVNYGKNKEDGASGNCE